MSAGQATLDVPPQVLEYLQQHKTLTLATASPAAIPRASTFLYVSDGPTLYFWSRATTVTARQLTQNPVVSFTVDDYTEDLSQTRGVQGMGECSVLLSGEQIARVADLFGQKFPELSPGSTMSISFFRITPTELQFIDNVSSGHAETASGTFGVDFHRERSYSVITDLPVQRVESIIATLQSIEVAAGDTIVRQGAPADKFFILVDGEAEALREEDGSTRRIASLKAGQLFGEVSIMLDQPRSATLRATTDARLLALGRDGFRDLIAEAMQITPDFDQVIRARLDARSSE
ncbi:MAG: cyclic nucleotide-binding domain-containing protein [Solirubrobacteraceae bacterium]